MDIGSKVRTILAKTLVLNPAMVKDEALLVDDLGVSSLDRFELIMDLEAELGFEIREEDLVGAKTVGDVIRCIDTQIKGSVTPQGA